MIARSQEIPSKYIHTLAIGLKSAGLIRASRGPSGGYELARDPGTITALDVILAVEGDLALVDCVLAASSCPRSPRCATRGVWCEVTEALRDALARFTIRDLAIRENASLVGLSAYSI